METKPKPLVVANWKCNGVKGSIRELIQSWSKHIEANADCVIACPSIYITFLQSILTHPRFEIAAQNCIPTPGAYTGEISVDQLRDCDVGYVIIGHSERRKHYAETEKLIGEKCRAVVTAGLHLIVCIGESLHQRKNGMARACVKGQLETVLSFVPANYWNRVVIAYEPVWSIGTGVVASPNEIEEMHVFIRDECATRVSSAAAKKMRIIYGGSVSVNTAKAIYKNPNVNGFLVGGASLNQGFVDIIEATRH